MKLLHIGIAACSSEGAALCYRTICAEAMERLGGHRHPEISMHSPPLSDYVSALSAGDLGGVAELMLTSAERLAAIGADILICPDNTVHAAMEQVRASSPLPWLHIADVVAAAAEAADLICPAVMGTRWLMESDVYSAALSTRGIRHLIPDAQARAEVDAIIMDELVMGRITRPARATLDRILADQVTRGADGVILACTELPMIMTGDLPVPGLDSTRLLARAALDRAVDQAVDPALGDKA